MQCNGHYIKQQVSWWVRTWFFINPLLAHRHKRNGKKRVFQMVDFTLYTYKKKMKKKKKRRRESVLVTPWSFDIVLRTRF